MPNGLLTVFPPHQHHAPGGGPAGPGPAHPPHDRRGSARFEAPSPAPDPASRPSRLPTTSRGPLPAAVQPAKVLPPIAESPPPQLPSTWPFSRMSSDSPTPRAVISPAAAGRRQPGKPERHQTCQSRQPPRAAAAAGSGRRADVNDSNGAAPSRSNRLRQQRICRQNKTSGHNQPWRMMQRIPGPNAPARRNAAGQA